MEIEKEMMRAERREREREGGREREREVGRERVEGRRETVGEDRMDEGVDIARERRDGKEIEAPINHFNYRIEEHIEHSLYT